ncbi:MAG: DUF4348 domain-containing protein [Bacteroidetes bacterium]|nr:DUF4348 domain-containing protein [Bacteroidota bacterium]
MKKTILILTITFVAFGLGYWTGMIKKSVDEKFEIVTETIETSNQTTKESFNNFIYKFIGDSLYQLDRIKFPLRSMRAGPDDYGTIKREDWKMVRLFVNEEYKAQLYDNFKGELRDTDERLFAWEGIENGISVQYKFRRIDGLWYLTEYNDFSD